MVLSRTVHVREVATDDPLARPVIEAHIAHSQNASPATSNHTLDPAQLSAEPGLRLWIAEQAGIVLGCGALKPLSPPAAEVKSVHVLQAGRGKGTGRAIMDAINEAARRAGFSELYLETGPESLPAYDAARRLYEGLELVYCGPFEGYVPDPHSAFMRLDLSARVGRPV